MRSAKKRREGAGPRRALPRESLAFKALREKMGWKQDELAAALGTTSKVLSQYETGYRCPAREVLDAAAEAMACPPGAVDSVLLGFEGLYVEPETSGSPGDPNPEQRREIRRTALLVGLAAIDRTEALLVRHWRELTAKDERERAAKLWKVLAASSPASRRLLIETAPEYQTWAVAERLAHESVKAAAGNARLALELARLAVLAGSRMLCDGLFRSRLAGYVLAFLANAERVAGDLPAAERTFAEAWSLWKAGAEGDPAGLLPEWRLLDLEASLRRAQRRLPEALGLLVRARAAAPPEVLGRILLKRAFTLEQLGDFEESIAALREATDHVDAEREPRLLFGIRFNLGVCLCHLGRAAEAQELLGQARRLAESLRTPLDLLRVLWLQGRVEAGLGRAEEAIASLEQVRRGFAQQEMPFDFALATLDLSLVLCEQGRHAEILGPAGQMVRLFQSLGVHREALASVQLLCEAAENGEVTAEMLLELRAGLRRARALARPLAP